MSRYILIGFVVLVLVMLSLDDFPSCC